MAAFKKASRYIVLVDFVDFKTGITYKAGDEFPVSTSITRLKDLLADDNEGRSGSLKGSALIEAADEILAETSKVTE
ncbi:hypothetical protein ESZ50_08000 [Weissella muntiaci]|uniref:Uncharacterized protein n=1 Tax=Weissella muntiaci TaxID=2508881 RepID=A0A6C2C4E6_9LACO|nr:hypothetical protein [Weissella muntiaci]TYC48811.1 hypothetical protein ESZ50_08000 [Weissella muntiaci]